LTRMDCDKYSLNGETMKSFLLGLLMCLCMVGCATSPVPTVQAQPKVAYVVVMHPESPYMSVLVFESRDKMDEFAKRNQKEGYRYFTVVVTH
jgi:hypothetical protein